MVPPSGKSPFPIVPILKPMIAIDSLIVAGIAVLDLGTIHEADGVIEREFALRNAGTNAVTLLQGYTSCGCTTIHYNRDTVVQSGDTTHVTLRFNPANRGGEFYESGTIAYASATTGTRRFVNVALQGACQLTDETLLRQHPIVVTDDVRISGNRYDLGYMTPGQQRQLTVSVLCRIDGTWQRVGTTDVSFTVDATMPKGLQHIKRTFSIPYEKRDIPFEITYDLIIK